MSCRPWLVGVGQQQFQEQEHPQETNTGHKTQGRAHGHMALCLSMCQCVRLDLCVCHDGVLWSLLVFPVPCLLAGGDSGIFSMPDSSALIPEWVGSADESGTATPPPPKDFHNSLTLDNRRLQVGRGCLFFPRLHSFPSTAHLGNL